MVFYILNHYNILSLAIDDELNFSRTNIYSYGLGWNPNEIVGIKAEIKNSFGETPATSLLTIPSGEVSTTTSIKAIADEDDNEEDEVIEVSISEVSSGKIGNSSKTSMVISTDICEFIPNTLFGDIEEDIKAAKELCLEQIEYLQNLGLNDFHFYTLNRSDLTYSILKEIKANEIHEHKSRNAKSWQEERIKIRN